MLAADLIQRHGPPAGYTWPVFFPAWLELTSCPPVEEMAMAANLAIHLPRYSSMHVRTSYVCAWAIVTVVLGWPMGIDQPTPLQKSM